MAMSVIISFECLFWSCCVKMNVRDETRHDLLRAFMYRDASHLCCSFSLNRTKISIQFLIDCMQCLPFRIVCHMTASDVIPSLFSAYA